MNNKTFHFLKTRATQRKLTKMLKSRGIDATSQGAKQPEGWQTTVKERYAILIKQIKVYK